VILLGLLSALLVASSRAARADDDEVTGPPREFKKIRYRSIGPAAGGRVSRSTGVPGNPLVYYAATASGGVWKSADGGATWKPIFDDQPISSIGAIAVAPSDPNVVYVGSGEANIRGNVAAGNGIYKSTDAGKRWKHVWKQEGQIGQLIVHPTNPNVAFAAVLGHAFGPNPERGVYRTADGGKTWKLVLVGKALSRTLHVYYKGKGTAHDIKHEYEAVGAIDVCFDATNPHILFAALWQTQRRPWELISGGLGSGLFRSDDGGDTWKILGPTSFASEKGKAKNTAGGHNAKSDDADDNGLPEGIWGRVGVAVAPSDGRRVYALIEADKGGLYRSDDGGKKWKLINPRHYLRQRPWYFTTLTVDPKNPDVVWAPTVQLLKSIDGGQSFVRVKGTHHGDHHDVWIDPKDPRRIIDSNDGGMDITVNGGETWQAPMLPISQFYHVSADTRTPYWVMGNMQDIGTAAGPSNSLGSEGIAVGDWIDVGGGETGFAVADPSNPNVVYAGEYGGYVTRFDYRTRQARNISIYPYTTSGHAAEVLRYRFQWTAPLLVSPHDTKVVYHAANVIFRTADGGKSWQKISPDLTRDDKTKEQWSGGPITGDNTGAEVYCTIFALAESPKKKGLLWAGSDDGLVHVSRDGGKNWENVSKNIRGLPEWGTVSCIEPSPFDEAVAYVVVDAHRLDDMRPYLFKTVDYGQSWRPLTKTFKDETSELPEGEYLHVVREDPKRKGLLYLGTERGVRFSTDDGANWRELKLNLPTVAVHDLVVKDNDLVVGTNGRSIWILDDLTPVRQLGAVKDTDVSLLPAQPAVRWRYHLPVYSTAGRSSGENPAKGALFHYALGKKTEKVSLEIRDAQARLVRRLTSKEPPQEEPEDHPDADEKIEEPVLPVEPGVHRVAWDLAYQGARHLKGAKADAGHPRRGPLVLPGTYTVKLTACGKEHTTTIEVRPDPRVTVPREEMQEQLKLILKVRDNIDRLVEIVDGVRSLRKQLKARNQLLKDKDKSAELVQASKAFVDKLDALEEKLHNPKAEVTYDILAQKGGAKLYSQLGALFGTLREADGTPTQGVMEVYADLARELEGLQTEWNGLLNGDLARLDALARKTGVPGVLAPR
jgi:photosystem II stability/assembly factor-like uncharacterized protein